LRFLSSFSGGCPQVSKKADLARFPRRLAWQALPLDGFLLFTGWPFTKNVELQCVSSAFGLACFPRLRSGQAGAAPPRLLSLCEALRAGHPPRLRYFLRARF